MQRGELVVQRHQGGHPAVVQASRVGGQGGGNGATAPVIAVQAIPVSAVSVYSPPVDADGAGAGRGQGGDTSQANGTGPTAATSTHAADEPASPPPSYPGGATATPAQPRA